MFRQRTKHPHYQRWIVAKGFGVVDRWLEFANFVADIGDKPSPSAKLRKKHYELPYGPDNFRWHNLMTRAEQLEAKKQGMARLYWGKREQGEPAWTEGHRNSYMKRRYGITVEDYDKMLAEQNGVCAICEKKDKRRLAVDHCHKTGTVRGLLCSSCNISVGRFDDNPDTLKRAIEYLQRER